MKKALTILIALLLLLAMTACDTADDTAAQTDPPPTITEPEPTPADIYNDAAAAIRAKADLKLKIDSEKTTLVGTQSFSEEEALTLSLKNVGTDEFIGKAAGVIRFGPDYSVMLEEYCFDGAVYGSLESAYYTASSTQDEFLGRYTPVVLLDPALYESVEFSDDNTIAFSGGTTAESWLDLEEGIPVEASGTATLENGQLVSTQYQVTYTYGSTDVTLDITAEIRELSNQIEAPDVSQRTYLALDTAEIPLILERGRGAVLQSKSLSVDTIESTTCSVANLSVSDLYSLDMVGIDDDLRSYYVYDMTAVDHLSGQSMAYHEEERFSEGMYTFYEDGVEVEASDQYSGENIRNYYLYDFYGYDTVKVFSDLEDMASVTLTEVPGGYVIDYTLTDAYISSLQNYVCERFFEDPFVLDEYATTIDKLSAKGYLAVDAVTGLPTAFMESVTITHTIYGSIYPLSYTHSKSFDAASLSADSEITGDPLPADTESQQPKPLFYKVTGENGETMWLLGTIHVGDGRTKNLPQEIYDALENADALALEFDMNQFERQVMEDEELAQQVMSAYIYTDGTNITDHLSDPELYNMAKQVMKFAGQYNATADYMRPVIWSSAIENFYLDLGYRLSADYGVDMQLLTLAEEQGKTILNVESGLEQMQMLTGFSDSLQERMLGASLSGTPAQYNAEVEALYEMWCAGDVEGIISDLYAEEDDLSDEEQLLYDEYTKGMETDRNAAMLEVAKGYLNSGDTVFYAVGLAHLLAEDGLVNTLRDAGYTVELVAYE